MLIREEIIGVIQLDRSDGSGFDYQDCEFIYGLGLQCSLAINWKRQEIVNSDQSRMVELLTSTSQISKSITSNLDLGNLINSVISHLHQRFGFSKVNIFMVQGGPNQALSRVGITDQGIEPSDLYYYDRDSGPVSWSVLHQEPIIINDTALENRFPPSAFNAYTKSELVIPLISGDMLIGVLDLCSGRTNKFSPATVQIYKLLADNIAVAIRNVRLYHFEQLKRQIAEGVQEVIGEISADLPFDVFLDKLLIELEKSLPFDASAIWLYDNVTSDTGLGQFTSTLKLAAVRLGDLSKIADNQAQMLSTNDIKDQLIQFEDDTNSLLSVFPWLSEIINSKEPILKTAVSSIEPLGQKLALPEGYSVLGGALYFNSQPIGLIILVDHLHGRYTSESQLIASSFLTYASKAIQNARLFTLAHEQVWLSTALLQVTETSQSITSLSELLDTIANLLFELASANGCMVYMWDPNTGAFFPQSSYGFETEQQARLNSWDIYSGSVATFDQLLQSGSPVILSSETLSGELASLIFPTYNLQTDLLILFPMIAQENLLGAILIDFTNTDFGKTSSQKDWDNKYLLIEGVIHQVAPAIETLQINKSREEEAYISIALLQVAQAIVSLNQLDEILASIVRITPILVGVKRCIIYLWDANNKVFHPAQYYGFTKNELPTGDQIIRSDEYPFIETILEYNQIAYHQLDPTSSPANWNKIAVGDIHLFEVISADSEEQVTIKLDEKQLRDKTRLLLGFPLSIKNEVLGVMLVEEEDPIKGLSTYHIREKRIEIVNGITQQAAIAIKNEYLQQDSVKSERMERELQLAREIQLTFLPEHLPELPGWDMDIRWEPARQVGGDFYDILILGENRLGFVIADVADKGMPAALFMTLIRTLIRAAAKDNLSPATVLKQVNELLIPDAKHGMFVTVFYGVFYLTSGKLIYTNAGHNPPLIRSFQSGELIELKRTCMALGIFDDIVVEEREVILNPGDWILLYTDGVTEAFSANEEMYGTKRLFDLLINNRSASSKELLDAIEGSVHEFIEGTELSDDMTLAAICRKVI